MTTVFLYLLLKGVPVRKKHPQLLTLQYNDLILKSCERWWFAVRRIIFMSYFRTTLLNVANVWIEIHTHYIFIHFVHVCVKIRLIFLHVSLFKHLFKTREDCIMYSASERKGLCISHLNASCSDWHIGTKFISVAIIWAVMKLQKLEFAYWFFSPRVNDCELWPTYWLALCFYTI